MGDPTDQVATVDTTGLGGKIPNIEEALVNPEILETPEEGDQEAALEARQITTDDSGEVTTEESEVPTSLAEAKEVEEEELAEESGEVAPDEVAPDEEVLTQEVEQTESGYDPGDHSVAEVLTYIQNNPNEREAVLAAERAGKARKGILEA